MAQDSARSLQMASHMLKEAPQTNPRRAQLCSATQYYATHCYMTQWRAMEWTASAYDETSQILASLAVRYQSASPIAISHDHADVSCGCLNSELRGARAESTRHAFCTRLGAVGHRCWP
eukprot:415896-Pyramimonas_sp.AAC.1